MKKIKFAVFLPILLGLSACGSDNDKAANLTPENPTPAIDNPAWNYIETPYFELPDYQLTGEANVVLGTLDDQIQPWVGNALDHALKGEIADFLQYDKNGDFGVNPADAKLAGIDNTEVGPVFTADLDKMVAFLAANPDGLGAGSARPDIFKSGAYSPFDLLRYLVGTRDDMAWGNGTESAADAVIKPTDSEFDTHQFRISWDMNGDGKFDADDGHYFNSDNWHYALKQSVGQNKQFGAAKLEFENTRMDNYWLRENQHYRFTAYSDEMINRLHWSWQQQVQRLADNEGKFIIPMVYRFNLDTEAGLDKGAPDLITTELEVKAHNLRSDVFQDGIISAMDIWLSVAEQTGGDYRFTWWPTMSSGAIVNGFTMMYNPFTGANGGWTSQVPIMGELAAAADFSPAVPQCYFNKDGSNTFNPDGTIAPPTDQVDRETCIKEWSSYNGIGGNLVNNIFGGSVLIYPPQYASIGTVNAESVRNGTEVNLQKGDIFQMYLGADELQHTAETLGVKGNQSLYPTEDVTGTVVLRPMRAATEESKVGNAPVLNELHFGWKIADCTQCHKDTVDNKNGHGGGAWPVNEADGFDFMQPYYCATCHGANGAPQGHNRAARCFWCHNTNNKDGLDNLWMDKHADASLPKFIPAAKNVSNQLLRITAPVNRENEHEPYGDLWVPSHNSDYTMSKTYPDPYSCGTCHGFEHELEPKVEQ